MSGLAGAAPKIGQRVEALGKDCTGKIAYIGSTQFAQGKWIGEWCRSVQNKFDSVCLSSMCLSL